MPPPPSASRSVGEEEWEAATTITASEAAVTTTGTAASLTAPPSVISGFSKDTCSGSGSELAMVVSRNSKDLVEIVKEVDEYFLKAADAGGQLSLLLEVPNPSFSAQNKGGEMGFLFEFHFSMFLSMFLNLRYVL